MKKLLMAVVAAFVSLTALADGEKGLYIINTETNTIPVAEIQKITFENGNVVVKKTTGESSTFAMTDISRMYFGELTTGIDEVAVEGSWDGKSITLAADCKVEVFNASGIAVSQGSFSKGDVINLESIPSGIYIVKIGDKSFKIAK